MKADKPRWVRILAYTLPIPYNYCYTSPKGIGWLVSIAVRKAAWEQCKFDNIVAGADYNFLKQTPVEARCDLSDPTLMVASVHPTNACKKSLGTEYTPEPWETIQKLWQ